MENKFAELGLRSALVGALAKQDIENPTEIQEKMIPAILEGKDVIGRSETGSGKTLAYLLPIFEKIDMDVKNWRRRCSIRRSFCRKTAVWKWAVHCSSVRPELADRWKN